MAETVFDRVQNLMKQHSIAFQVSHHEPVFTSEEAARVRGTPPASGAKALICKGENTFVMFVLPADRKLDSPAVRRAKGWRKLRFATRDEVMELTNLAPGSIPPFGSLFGLPTLCDVRLGENEVINFNRSRNDHPTFPVTEADVLRHRLSGQRQVEPPFVDMEIGFLTYAWTTPPSGGGYTRFAPGARIMRPPGN